jgi:hypothetical protein
MLVASHATSGARLVLASLRATCSLSVFCVRNHNVRGSLRPDNAELFDVTSRFFLLPMFRLVLCLHADVTP